MQSVAYSPDGCHIISRSYNCTIQIWDAETGATVGSPLKGHVNSVQSVAYSLDGHHIISGSSDHTIRIWDAQSGVTLGNSLEGHAGLVQSVAYASDAQHIIPGSSGQTTHVLGSFPSVPIRPSHCHPNTLLFVQSPT